MVLVLDRRSSHRRPDKMRSFSAVEAKDVLLEMAQMRSGSDEEVAARMAERACDQVGGLGLLDERTGCSLSLRRPISYRTLTNYFHVRRIPTNIH